jgi:hypothetical protein
MSKITNPNIIDKAAAILHIDTEKKPVIFWDTCSLLDIVRLPLPDRKQTVDSLEKVIEIKNKIVSKDIISISSELCITEFNNHIETWTRTLELESKKLSKTFNNFIGFINKVNLGATPIPQADLSVYRLEDLLCQIIHAITNETLFISEDNTFATFAHFRTTNKIPPAKKKGEYKDCYVWGTCLEIRQTNSDKSYPYNFMSSNVTDYADNNKIDFVTEIKNETTINNINYFSNFKIAYGKLKRDRIV